ncbi:hypothetical protein DFH06DRAFT_1122473 [Mycena polygramma]|nr:hypothetical protein DFH06DRAFT_1122473 [Mycena polygramma]
MSSLLNQCSPFEPHPQRLSSRNKWQHQNRIVSSPSAWSFCICPSSANATAHPTQATFFSFLRFEDAINKDGAIVFPVALGRLLAGPNALSRKLPQYHKPPLYTPSWFDDGPAGALVVIKEGTTPCSVSPRVGASQALAARDHTLSPSMHPFPVLAGVVCCKSLPHRGEMASPLPTSTQITRAAAATVNDKLHIALPAVGAQCVSEGFGIENRLVVVPYIVVA